MNARAAKARNRARRERLQRILGAAAQATPQLVKVVGTQELWQRGRVGFVMPALLDGYPPALKDALDRRRRATLSGRCDCGGRWQIDHSRIVLEHKGDCVATDRNLIDIATECGVSFGRWVA